MQTSAVEELEDVEVAETETPSDKSNHEVTMMSLDDIKIGDRLRDIDEAKATVLAKSIETLGLMSPIILDKDNNLVAGLHRYTACKMLGYREISAIVKDYTPLDRELAEIEENLVRFDLTDMQRSIQVARRQQIYGIKFPQTLDNKKRAELRKKWEEEGKPKDNPQIPNFDSDDAKRDDVKSFIADTAELTGRSTTQVRDEANLGRALIEELSPEVRNLIAPTAAAENKSDLKRLINEPDADIQYEAAQMVRESYDAKLVDDSVKELKLSDALNQLQKNPTYETTVTDSGEETLHRTLQKTLKALEISVNSPRFSEVAETWTWEGLDDIREDFYRIENLSKRGSDVLTDLMDKKEKLGKGKGKA